MSVNMIARELAQRKGRRIDAARQHGTCAHESIGGRAVGLRDKNFRNENAQAIRLRTLEMQPVSHFCPVAEQIVLAAALVDAPMTVRGGR